MFTTRPTLHAAFVAAALAVAAPACATDGVFVRYSQYSRDDDRRIYDAGYKRGLEDGRHDARDRRPFDYSRHEEYRKADRREQFREDLETSSGVVGLITGVASLGLLMAAICLAVLMFVYLN